jgi:hypothetical protein
MGAPNFLDYVKMLKNKESGDFYHHSLWGVLGVRVNLGYLYGLTFEAGYDKKKVRMIKTLSMNVLMTRIKIKRIRNKSISWLVVYLPL